MFITIVLHSPGVRYIYTDLMDEFVLRGHKVYVAGTPYPQQQTDIELNEENGIQVLRVQSGKIRKASPLRKAISLLTLGRILHHGIEKHFNGIRFDLILSPTPPVTLSSLFRKLKKEHHASFYLLLKDIWPQGSVDLKVLRKYSLPWIYLRRHEKRTYRAADVIGTMSPMNVEYLLLKNENIPRSKVEVCPNSIRPSSIARSDEHREVREKYGIPPDACVFLFSGNLGRGHGLGFLIEAIKELADYPKAFFVIGGSGTHFNMLKEAFDTFPTNNVFLYSWLPRREFELMLQTSDAGLILLDKLYTTPEFPSRLLSYLDSGMPVLCAINKDTDIGSVVEGAKCGTSVRHGDTASFVKEVRYYSENIAERLKMGINARKLLQEHYTADIGYNIIMKHFDVP